MLRWWKRQCPLSSLDDIASTHLHLRVIPVERHRPIMHAMEHRPAIRRRCGCRIILLGCCIPLSRSLILLLYLSLRYRPTSSATSHLVGRFLTPHSLFPSSLPLSLSFPSAVLAATSPSSKQQCNLASGQWVYDASLPLYNGDTCRQYIRSSQNCQRQGRTDMSYQKYRYQVGE